MAKYEVDVCRIGYGYNTMNVIADNEEEATRMALDKAGDMYYSEKDADYEVQDVRLVEKQDKILQRIVAETNLQLLKSMRKQWGEVFGTDTEEHYYLTKLVEELELRTNGKE